MTTTVNRQPNAEIRRNATIAAAVFATSTGITVAWIIAADQVPSELFFIAGASFILTACCLAAAATMSNRSTGPVPNQKGTVQQNFISEQTDRDRWNPAIIGSQGWLAAQSAKDPFHRS